MGRSSPKNNYTHRSMPPKPAIHKPYRPHLRPMRPNMNVAHPNRTTFNKPAHSYAKRPFQRTSVVRPQFRGPRIPTVTRKFPTINRKFPTGNTKVPNAEQECIVLGRDFKLIDNSNVLLRTPRQHNIYSIDLNNNVPHKDLTCLVAKASADECMLWNRRLGHLNFKIMNRCDNGGEFRNQEMNDFCLRKGIKREFSNARAPQQNGVAKRRNRTLIEVARTMLADAKLPVTFWAEAVNTALVGASTQSTNFLGTKDAASQEVKKDVSSLRYIALPNWVHDVLLESTSSNAQDTCKADAPESSGNPNPTAFTTNPLAD
uniref:Ribonuclease H-like domain-containing protein n=1 Tax=Tanacetum cinerariifolium TaxID=118510 RepID=A0A699J4L8_TANCI|nr:ribonuclease H-like domain-containing protein [Tanacetum cinerariifolium]